MSKTVLLIDDSKTQLETMKLNFQKSGFEVVTAINATDGYCKIFSAIPDLIISDIIMPDLTGHQLSRLIKNHPIAQNIPVVLLTALDQRIDKFWSKKCGANAFIPKSAGYEEIIELANRLIGEFNISPSVKESLKKECVEQSSIQNQVNLLLDDSLMLSSILNEFRKLSKNIANEKLLAQNIFKLTSSIIEYDVASILFLNPDKLDKNFVYINSYKRLDDKRFNDIKEDLSKSVISDLGFDFSQAQQIHFPLEYSKLQKKNVKNEFRTKLIYPLKFADQPIGYVSFYSFKKKDFSKDFKFFDSVFEELTLLFKLKKFYGETMYLSVTDSLTTLYNRRHFDTIIEREFARSFRYKAPLTLCLIDFDYFKNINDTYGHKAGDYTLEKISKLILQNFRKTDYIFRFGGEEIMIIMPETNVEDAVCPAQRLRREIEKIELEYDNNRFKMTLSIGLADNRSNVANINDFIKNVDKALYYAKNHGRNQVTTYASII